MRKRQPRTGRQVNSKAKPDRRGFVVGHFKLQPDGKLVLYGVTDKAGHSSEPQLHLACAVAHMRNWRTRQAAHEWMTTNGWLKPYAVWNLDQLFPDDQLTLPKRKARK